MGKAMMVILLMLFISCTKSEKVQTPRIDTSLIKANHLIWDLEALQHKPEYIYSDSISKVREIVFDGPDYNGEKTKVFAYYSNPDILKTGSNLGNTFPGVVLISGGNQPALKSWVERWAHQGYAAITCDYGNTRMSEGFGPIFTTLNERLAWIYDSIRHGAKSVRAYRTAAISIQAHSLLLSFPEVEKEKTAVTGISWGGFQTLIVSGLDNRFKAAASVYGCAFRDEIELDKVHFNKMNPKQQALWMSQIDPKNYLLFSQCPTLFINGNTDGCFDIVPFNKTTKLIPEAHRYIKITPNMAHGHATGWKPKEIVTFFDSILKGGVPLAKITKINRQDPNIKFTYQSSVTLRSAHFYYSNDTVNRNEKRIWKSIPAKIFKNEIVSPIPQEGYHIGFLYAEDVMDLGVSSELISRIKN